MRLRILGLVCCAVGGLAGVAAGGRPGRTVRVDHASPARVRVEGGRFTMGLPPDDIDTLVDECQQVITAPASFTGGVDGCTEWGNTLGHRAHRDVWVSGFWIDVGEVTVREYRACVWLGRCELDPLFVGDSDHLRDELPVVNITRDEAETFCEWRGGRLPTEAEWEKAARGPDLRTWPWGDDPRPGDFNHGKTREPVLVQLDKVGKGGNNRTLGDADPSDGYAYAAPPGSLPWSDGPYGTHDQAGNVAEWVLDDYSERGLDGLPEADPVRRGPSDALAMTRGGSWRDPAFLSRVDVPSYLSAFTDARLLPPDLRAVHIGFRCVYDGAIPDAGPPPPSHGP